MRAYLSFPNKVYNGSYSKVTSSSYSNLYASYSSKYVNNKDRTTNLRIASKAIDGTVIQPGQTFSFNKVVGKRTKSRGYKEACSVAAARLWVLAAVSARWLPPCLIPHCLPMCLL